MFVFAMESMAVSLLAGNANAGAFTTDCLAGQAKGSPGLMQTCVTKKKLVSWFFEDISSKINAASGAEVPLTAEGYQQFRDAFTSPKTVYQKFARARSASEQDSCSLSQRILGNSRRS